MCPFSNEDGAREARRGRLQWRLLNLAGRRVSRDIQILCLRFVLPNSVHLYHVRTVQWPICSASLALTREPAAFSETLGHPLRL